MPGRSDPPHERVTLSAAERRAVNSIEQDFERIAYDERGHGRVARFRSWRRAQRVGVRLAWCRWGPWLVLLGAIVMVAAVAIAPFVAAMGAVIAGLGLAGWMRRPRPWR